MSDATAVLAWLLDHIAVGTFAGILWIARLLHRHDSTLDKHGNTLYGDNGDNGLRGDVKELRARKHELAEKMQAHTFQIADHDRRILHLESDEDRSVA